jgi:glycosyltransferase involved in cell wall biosynthesis
MEKISVTILTKNSEKYLQKVLSALSVFDEVLIYDNGSSDKTLEIAREFSNTRICVGQFIGFGKTHNTASAAAKNDWIFSIDSDEEVTPALVQEIEAINLDKAHVYSIPRNNFFNGKWIKGCGWYPDRQIRVYNRKATQFTNDEVHERVLSDGMEIVELRSPINHYSYESITDFLSKMQTYSTLFAKQNKGKKSSSTCKAVLHSWFAFFKSYILKKGFLDGKEGFIISRYNANTAFYKYLKLAEANNKDLR